MSYVTSSIIIVDGKYYKSDCNYSDELRQLFDQLSNQYEMNSS